MVNLYKKIYDYKASGIVDVGVYNKTIPHVSKYSASALHIVGCYRILTAIIDIANRRLWLSS